MSGMTPWEFFEGFVCDDYEDWKTEPTSIRRAFHVAVSAFHLADHYFSYNERHNAAFASKYKKLEKFQAALTDRTPEFKVVQDMANTFKHLYPRASCSISSGGAIENVAFDGDEIEHDWETEAARIIIRHRDGRISIFSSSIDAVMEMWTEIISDDPATV